MSVCVCAFWSELFLATWHCSEEILISLRLEPMTVCKHLHAIKVLIAILTQTRWCQKRELRIRVKGLKAFSHVKLNESNWHSPGTLHIYCFIYLYIYTHYPVPSMCANFSNKHIFAYYCFILFYPFHCTSKIQHG